MASKVTLDSGSCTLGCWGRCLRHKNIDEFSAPPTPKAELPTTWRKSYIKDTKGGGCHPHIHSLYGWDFTPWPWENQPWGQSIALGFILVCMIVLSLPLASFMFLDTESSNLGGLESQGTLRPPRTTRDSQTCWIEIHRLSDKYSTPDGPLGPKGD